MKNSKTNNLKNVISSTMIILLLALTFSSCSSDSEGEILTEKEFYNGNSETSQYQVAILRKEMRKYRDFNKSLKDGYVVAAGPYVPNMGYHRLNPALLDNNFDLLKPEILLYVPDKNGNMQFVAVEYLIPVENFDNPPPAPEGFNGDEDHWHLNPNAGGWTLHVWVEKANPDGIFASHNRKVP